MEWIENIDPIVFWTAAGAIVACAGVLGGAVAAGVNKWWDYRTRPEPGWTVELNATARDRASYSSLKGVEAEIRGRISNTGDASAYRVGFAPDALAPVFITGPPSKGAGFTPTEDLMPSLEPGASAAFVATIDFPEDWGTLAFTLTWIAPPTRLQKTQKYRVRVADQVKRPLLHQIGGNAHGYWIDPLTKERVDPEETSETG